MMFFDASARELLELWAVLDAGGRAVVIDFAKRLIERATFVGGPFDGHPVTEEDREFVFHSFDHGPDRMAVYEADDRGRFVFVDVRPADDVAAAAGRDGRAPGGISDPGRWSGETEAGQ
jgi:hypothetical protein